MSQSSVSTLPGTTITLRCGKCGADLTAVPFEDNPFPSPVENRQEWFAFSYLCIHCGDAGKFQYRVKEENQ